MGWLDTLKALFCKSTPPPPGNAATAGPAEDEHPPVTGREAFNANIGTAATPAVFAPQASWNLGLWVKATFRPAHPGRVGPQIKPQCSVVHTTDMHPDAFSALVKSWTTQPGAGNGAHFLIGRGPEQGVIQFASITRNSNHAGGNGGSHGWYRTAAGALVHPNTVAVGIEVHNAGRLYKDPQGRWRCGEYQDSKLVYSGAPLPMADVYLDTRGHGWHLPTAFQLDMLEQLLSDLQACYPPNFTLKIQPNGGYVANGSPWAEFAESKVVGHVTLDPLNKTDPGPHVCGWIKENF